jgi:formylglycine-generating enzyme required for sulfatase activity
MTNCGQGGSGTESCCASPAVTGGTFDRSYDGVTYTDTSFPATVSGLRLDRYEVTVGRFRQFVGATAAGWTPAAGAGKHTHLAGGGLNGGTESGWDASWTPDVPATTTAWGTALGSCGSDATWTATAAANENRPINCVSWYEAYAFCIWDAGFLPSEAEWNYASSGGGDQRAYPWSQPPMSTAVDCTYANYTVTTSCASSGTIAVGSDSPKGDGAGGKWGQADLAGNVFEWALDWYVAPYAGGGCSDCAYLAATTARVMRGGSYAHGADRLLASFRGSFPPTSRGADVGLRCARAP